eukprot:CAMPEP_0198504456 /NCGR_PEP_ID=MMETSP1462-20131121/10509_1 /TAXON_ID=1333877 /ORGANISM="Brandtodinium nutriculum, Strain RCC3387" /LENGTH=338 /DNA_ID=CAMNT_0044233627 /DNA_START=53 /DNA_END=1069 /DNA_ORIENTATION=+
MKLDDVLRSVASQYPHKDRVRNDVAALMKSCGTLIPETHTRRNGHGAVREQATIFRLKGVLPMGNQGSKCKIPVVILFNPLYPSIAPACFVTPSDTVAIKLGHPHVDQGGLVTFPYLSQWTVQSNLVEMVVGMISIFSVQPPVYSKQATPVAQATPSLRTLSTPKAQPMPSRPHTSRKVELTQKATVALKAHWPIVVEPLVIEANDHLKTNTSLRAAARQLDQLMVHFSVEEAEQARRIEELEAFEGELKSYVEANEATEPCLDGLKESLSPDSAQVLELVAEECALREFLGALDELLSSGKISTDQFLRETRDVGRCMFMCQLQRKKNEAAATAAGT